jgi:hypothetical protein
MHVYRVFPTTRGPSQYFNTTSSKQEGCQAQGVLWVGARLPKNRGPALGWSKLSPMRRPMIPVELFLIYGPPDSQQTEHTLTKRLLIQSPFSGWINLAKLTCFFSPLGTLIISPTLPCSQGPNQVNFCDFVLVVEVGHPSLCAGLASGCVRGGRALVKSPGFGATL